MPQPVSLPRLLDHGLELRPDHVALITAEGNFSWRQLDHASKCYAMGLQALGLNPGDRIASLMPNCAAVLIHYLACFRAGLVITPLNYRYTSIEIDRALDVSGARMLLHHIDRDADIAASRARELSLEIVTYGAGTDRRPSFEAMVENAECAGEFPELALSAPAAIFFTSGSTGPAKGVTHSFESLGWAIGSFAGGCRATADDIVMLAGSMSHIGAFLDAFAAFSAGGSVVIPQGFDGPTLLSSLRAYRPTILMTLPVVLFGLVRAESAAREDFSSLRLLSAGGDKVPLGLIEEMASLAGLSINEQYGMSEIGIVSINPPDGPNKLGSVGRPIAGYTISIRGFDGNDMPRGTPGRLWVKSPCNMVGYWGDPDATQAVFSDGWFDTGDVMTMDDDGYLWFMGRQKQLIVRDGSNISPQEVEDALTEHPAVAAAGVVGVPDILHGENVHAFVTFKPGVVQPSMKQLIDFARARVGYKAPEQVVALKHMPLNATEKIDRVVLKAMAKQSFKGKVIEPAPGYSAGS